MSARGLLLSIYRRVPSSPLKDRLSEALRRRASRRNVVEIALGLKMDLDIWEWTQNQISRHGRIEPLTTHRFGGLLEEGGVYVDVGAHVGYHSLIARRAIGASGRVVAIEPLPYNCAKILTNWSLNGFENIVLYPAAAGDVERFVNIRDQPAKDRSRLSLNAASVAGDQPQAICVPIVRLDRVFDSCKIDRVDLLKIDAEGFEVQVLEGMGETIQRCRSIIVELCEPASEPCERVANRLSEMGFVLGTVLGDEWDGNSPLLENNLVATRLV